MSDPREARIGVLYGLAAYTWWGFVALYFKAVSHVAPLEVLAHRVLWSAALLVTLMLAKGRLSASIEFLRHRRTFLALLGTTVLIASNWFVFIWAIGHDRVLQASLGYFINPLVNVLLGFVFLRERLRRAQVIGVGLATLGVVIMGVRLGGLPTVALALAFSFGLYGLLRKVVRADALAGLTTETMLLLPLAASYLLWLRQHDALSFGSLDTRTDILLAAGGMITAIPLLWFANAARRLRYATVGFLQYIAPSLQFLLAIAVFGENFTSVHALSFGLIWVALAVYSYDAIVASRTRAS